MDWFLYHNGLRHEWLKQVRRFNNYILRLKTTENFKLLKNHAESCQFLENLISEAATGGV